MDIIEKLGITPGPWRWTMIDEHTPQLEGTNKYSDMNPVLVAFDCGCGVRKEDNACPLRPTIEDQKIIAASPEVLKALINLVNCRDSRNIGVLNYEAKIIIKKATGKSWDEIKGLLNESI